MQEDRKFTAGPAEGQIVFCKAGREKGKFMIVTAVIDEEYVMLADGKTRKVLSPKKKKIKHIQKTNSVPSEIAMSIKDMTITDRDVRNALSEFCNKGVKNEQK